MGCSSCKSKNRQNKNSKKVQDVTFETVEGGEKNVSSNEGNDQVKDFLGSVVQMAPKNFFLKLITFSAIMVVLPLLSVYLIFHIFASFFFTKNGKVSVNLNWLINGVSYPFKKWKSFRQKAREKARKRDFDKNRGYGEDSELNDIDVFESVEVKQKTEYTGEEVLEGVELVEKTNKDNDNE